MVAGMSPSGRAIRRDSVAPNASDGHGQWKGVRRAGGENQHTQTDH